MSSDAEAPVQSRSTGSSRATATLPGELKSLGKYQIERKLGVDSLDLVMLVAVGAGYTTGGMLMRWAY